MRTDGDKSLLFMLSVSYSTEVIIIIVSLTSLRKDIKNRYNKTEIKYVK